MRTKSTHRILALFLALLLTAALGAPAVSAAEAVQDPRQQQATLGELIDMDRELMQNMYAELRSDLPKTIVPSFQENPEGWALAGMLASQKALIGWAAWSEAQNVMNALQQGREPTPAQEQVKLAISQFDLEIYRNGIKNSLPGHWLEIGEPSDGVREELVKSSGQTRHSDQMFTWAPNMQIENWLQGHQQAIDTNSNYVFYPECIFLPGMGYAAIFFQVVYKGNTSLTIDGISQIELKDKRSGMTFVGGTVGGDYGSSFFRGPIQVNKGESAYFIVVFDPGTWYDLDFADLYDANGDANCAVQVTLTNHNAEAA
ncbi:MAG: hypothetical protein ACI4IA_06490 [Acutalibacteraceae bacterium]